MPPGQNIRQKQYCNKFSKDFKNGPHQQQQKSEKLNLKVLAFMQKQEDKKGLKSIIVVAPLPHNGVTG